MKYIKVACKLGKDFKHDLSDYFINNGIVFVPLKKAEHYRKLFSSTEEKVIVLTSGTKVKAIGCTKSNFDYLNNFSEKIQNNIKEKLSNIELEKDNDILAIKVDLFSVSEDVSLYRRNRMHFIKDFEYREKINKILEKHNIKRVDENIELLKKNKNLIFTGAPGTGKTYLAKQIASKLCFDKDYTEILDNEDLKKAFDNQCGFVQFHPSYDYTDFVEGLRPVNNGESNIGFERRDGVFKEFCKRALENYRNSYNKEEYLIYKKYNKKVFNYNF